MRDIVLAFLCVTFVSVSALSNTNPVGRILGGSAAYNGQFPYHVSIRNGTCLNITCLGAIITPNWVLTAAVCIRGLSLQTAFVVAGTNYLSPSGTIFPIARIVIHALYNQTTFEHNIGLVKTNLSLLSIPNTSLIGLPNAALAYGTIVTLTGWNPSTPYPINLVYLDVPLISITTCQSFLPPPNVITYNNLCTYYVGRGGCANHGDLGGALVFRELGATALNVYGILSIAHCGATGKPDVYINVVAYLSWILSNAN